MTVQQSIGGLAPPISKRGDLEAVGRNLEGNPAVWLGVVIQYVAQKIAAYYDNFLSKRFLGYQLIGWAGAISVKFLLPTFGILDDTGYGGALLLQLASAGGNFALQFPAYVCLEHRRYGQPIGSAMREFLAWRIPEIILGPGRYFDAFQANQTSGVLGDSVSAAATSLPLSLGYFASYATAPITQGIYRRLQLRKEQGIQTGARDVFRIVWPWKTAAPIG